jgi:hypothetical protein
VNIGNGFVLTAGTYLPNHTASYILQSRNQHNTVVRAAIPPVRSTGFVDIVPGPGFEYKRTARFGNGVCFRPQVRLGRFFSLGHAEGLRFSPTSPSDWG